MAYIGKIPGVTILSVNDLTDVNTDSPQAGEFLIYDSATSAYLSQAVTTDTITEGNNLYYTTVRFDSDLASATSIAAIRGYVSASGDLSYNSGTGVFSIDVETIYTTANFDSDFNIALDGAALGGTGLTYNSTTNTLSITNTGVVAGTYGSTSEIPVFSVNAQGQIDSAGVVSVAGVTGVDFDSATGRFTVTTGAGTSFNDVITLDPFTTSDLTEGNNLYYTTARGDSDTLAYLTNNSYATQTYVNSSINSVLDGAPAALDTLNELAAAINDDSNFAGTVTANLATKLNITDFDSTFDARLATKSTTNLSEGSNLYYTTARFDSDFGDKTTSNLTEGSNLYYTTARANSDFDTRLATKSTTDVSEGTNKYYTDERVDDRVSNLLVGGAGINILYNDSNNLLEIRIDSAPEVGYDLSANTTDDLSEGISNLYYTKVRVDSDVAQGFADRTTSNLSEGSNLYYTTARFDSDFGDNTTSDLTEGSNLYYTKVRVDSDVAQGFTDRTTSDLNEGSNLYYTTARADSDFDNRLATKSTSNLSEGNNLYYTKVRVDSDVAQGFTDRTTDNLSEGATNLYYTTARADSDFDNRLATKSTSNLSEGNNLYYTTARADSDFDNRLATKSTSNVSEGTNLYYTTARFDSDFGDNTTSDLTEGSNLYYTDTRARASISVTDAGGDGSLGYDSGTGVFTYTGPSASEVRAHFSAGTGVTLSSGQISIGQAVGITDSAVFASVTTTGNVVVGGNLQVTGTTTTVNSQDLNVTDNMIYMNAGESSGSPTLSIDVGWAANVNDNGSYTHVGMFRDATDDRFKVFGAYTPEPDAALEINTGHASFALADFQASTFYGNLTGNVTGNASTASSLDSASRISLSGDITGSVTFDGSQNVTLSTTYNPGSIVNDDINASAGIVDTKLATISTSGKVSNSATTATNANTASAIVARDGSGNFSAGTITASLTGNVTGNVTGTVSDISNHSTTDLSEGNNLYYTTARADSDFDTRLATKSTSNITEGTNLYYTTARFDSDFADNTTSDLTEGSNLYYTTARFDSDFADNTTSDLTEGSNLYYTTARFDSDFADNTTSDLTEGSNLYYTTARFDSDFGNNTTSDLTEGSNLYYTKVRVDSDFDARLTLKSTSDLSEGTNLYYTTARADSDVAAYLTTNSYATQTYVDNSINNVLDGAPAALDTLNELAAAINDDSNFAGTVTTSLATKLNITAFDSTFDTRLATKTTDDLSEGSTNQYFTQARARGSVSVTDNGGDGSLSYDSGTGVFTYTGPSASEVRAHFSDGAAIDIVSGQISVDLSELSTSTANGDGDYFVVVDASNNQRKLTKGNINISGFNNDAGYTTNVGDITAVTASTGLTGGGTSGSVTLSVATNGISATQLNVSGNGTSGQALVSDGDGSFSWSTISGGSADFSAVAEDILPSLTEVYDLGSTTKRWYDVFVSNTLDINGAALTGSKTVVSAAVEESTVTELVVDNSYRELSYNIDRIGRGDDGFNLSSLYLILGSFEQQEASLVQTQINLIDWDNDPYKVRWEYNNQEIVLVPNGSGSISSFDQGTQGTVEGTLYRRSLLLSRFDLYVDGVLTDMSNITSYSDGTTSLSFQGFRIAAGEITTTTTPAAAEVATYTLTTASDLVTGSLLVDNLLLSDNLITPDDTTTRQYGGDQGWVVVNGNLDVEGDLLQLPVAETSSTTTSTTEVVDVEYIDDDTLWENTSYTSRFDYDVNIYERFLLQEASAGSLDDFIAEFDGVGDPSFYENGVDIVITNISGATDTTKSFKVNQAPSSFDIGGGISQYVIYGVQTDGVYENFSLDGVTITITKSVTTTTTTSTAPLTTGLEGSIRFNKDTGSFEGYDGTAWGSLGGISADEDGNATIDANLIVTGDVISLSDENLKENIAPVESALSIVEQINGVYYNLKSDPEKRHVGVIAQNIEEVLPEVVYTSNGSKSVAYGNVVGVLIEAIKELKEEIEILKGNK